MFSRRNACLISMLLVVACAEKNPAPVSSYQEIPTVKISQTKINPSYQYVLEGEYNFLHELDEAGTKSIEEALKADPQSSYLKIRLSYQYAKNDNVVDALRLIDEVLVAEPANFEALFLRARILAVRGEFEQSKAVFLKILDLPEIKNDDERRAEVSFILASLYLEKGELVRAEELLKQIIRENPEHLISYYYLGRVYSEKNQMKEAIGVYKKSVEIDPRFSLGWRALGLIYEYLNENKNAIQAYEQVVALETLNIDVRTKLIDMYMKEGDSQRAIEQIAFIKQMYPNVPDVSVRLGLFYFQEKMFPQAEAEFAETLRKFKSNTELYYYLGLTQYQLKKKELAEKNFTRVSVDSEIYPVSQLALSSLYEELGNRQKSETVLRKALQRKPESVDLRVGLASNLIRKKNFDDAKKILDDGIRSSPKEERYYLSLAEIHEKRKEYDAVEKSLRTLLALNPNNPNALNFLGYSYADRNIKLNEAEDMILKAVKLKPNDGFILDSLGWLYFKKKDYKKAEEYIRKALVQIPEEPVILDHLGDVLAAQGKKKEAIESYKKSLENSEDPEKRGELENKIKKLSH
ncbi:MAG: tetratricopeptide repeat protein [Bdellovibrionota bacterium]